MSETLVGYLLAGSALLLFSCGILVTKVASRRIDLSLGFLVAATTNVAFSALLFLVQLMHRPDWPQWDGHAFLLFALAGVFSTYLGRWFFYESVVRFGPSRASVFQVSSPLFTAVMAWVLLGERLSPLLLAGMMVTVGGLMLVSYKPGFFSRKAISVDSQAAAAAVTVTPHQRLLQSVLVLGMVSSLAYAVGNILRGAGVRLWNEPVLGALVGAAAGLTLHVAFSADRAAMSARLRRADRLGVWLYVLIGVTTISAQICTITAMRFIPTSVATLVTLCTPVLVFPLSYVLFGNSERVGWGTLAGCGMTLAGIFIIVMR